MKIRSSGSDIALHTPANLSERATIIYVICAVVFLLESLRLLLSHGYKNAREITWLRTSHAHLRRRMARCVTSPVKRSCERGVRSRTERFTYEK